MNSSRKIFTVGVIGAVAIIALIVGVMLVQTSTTSITVTETTSIFATQTSSSSSQSVSTASLLSGPTGVLGVSLTDPPTLPPSVTNVFITYSSIQVHLVSAGNSSGWYTVASSGSIDLLKVINVSLTLGSSEVVTGEFNLIAFNITSAAVTVNGANQTAYVPADRINVPILGGVSVTKGNSSGVLVDLSPEVVPYQNGTSISYALVPAAKSLPIPPNVWNINLENKGSEIAQIQNQSWIQQSLGKVVVTGIKITPNVFSLTVKNTGKTNASFSSIAIGAVAQLNSCIIAPSAPSRPASPTANATTVTISTPSTTYSGQQLVTIGGKVSPVPTSSVSVSIFISNPNGARIESISEPIGSTGTFFFTFTTDYLQNESSLWVGGQYTITAEYNGGMGTASFVWNPQTTTAGITTSSTQSYNIETSSVHATSSSVTTHTDSTTQTSVVTKTVTSSSSHSSSSSGPTSMTVLTDQTSYSGQVKILVHGGVSPPPTTSYYSVVIRIINPSNSVVYSISVPVSVNGQFNASFVAGEYPNVELGSSWINGTYTVYASHDSLSASTSFTWKGTVQSTAHTTVTTKTSTTSTGSEIQNYICGLYATQNTPGILSAFPIAYYEILSNNTLLPINYTAIILGSIDHSLSQQGSKGSTPIIPTNSLSYVLKPNQTVTFTYVGTINTLSSALLSLVPKNFAVPSSIFGINPGQEYAVVASGADTRVLTLVNATAS